MLATILKSPTATQATITHPSRVTAFKRIDLLVYTRPQFEQFLASQRIFSKRVLSEAVRIS